MEHIDLHVHTTASDGTMTPSEAVCHAKELGLSAVAVTDHDSCEGVPEAVAAGVDAGIEVVPGIEISVDYEGHGVHLLGYFIDPSSAAMEHLLDMVIAERKRRNRLMAEALRADGIDVRVEELRERYPDSVVGRPHFAAALVELGLAESVKDAFDRYLSIGQKSFRPRQYIPLKEAFAVIRDAGGKAVLAHPLQYRLPEPELLKMISVMKDAGAVGMECLYFGYRPERMEYLQELAQRFDLCVTGGSDYHGSRKPEIEMGTPFVPYRLLEELRCR